MSKKQTYLYDGETFERGGRTFKVTFPYDDSGEAPWERAEGHGPVSDWTRRNKVPGERVLSRDRGLKRFYDYAEAIKIAKRDGWGLGEQELNALHSKLGKEPTRKQIAACAVEKDYEYLRRWCDNQWWYVGVVVELLDADGNGTGETESVWGIESDAYAYLAETANELADQINARLDTEAAEAAFWAERDVVTEG